MAAISGKSWRDQTADFTQCEQPPPIRQFLSPKQQRQGHTTHELRIACSGMAISRLSKRKKHSSGW